MVVSPHHLKRQRIPRFQRVEPVSNRMVADSLSKGRRSRAYQRSSIAMPNLYNNRVYAPPRPKVEAMGVEPTTCEIALIFINSIFAAFSSMYVNDSIAPLSVYLTKYYENINDELIGWLSSVIFCPSLFMALVIAPFINRYGPMNVGIFCHIWFILTTIIMPFIQHNYVALLIMRIVFGLLSEPSWLVQSALIAKYMPSRLESLGFGVCMSISTSANLLGFGFIPPLFSKIDIQKIQHPINRQDPLFIEFENKIKLAYWLNVVVCLISFAIYLACGLPLLRIDKAIKKINREREDQSSAFRPELPVYIDKKILPTLPNKNNRIPFLHKLKHAFMLPLDYWPPNLAFSLLLGCAYGCQTLILSYLSANKDGISEETVEYFGIVRSVMSVVGGPVSGLLVGAIGQRPILTLLGYIMAIVGFVLTIFLPDWYNMIPMAMIGFVDGGSAAFTKSLLSSVVPYDQLSIAYAIDESLLNLWQFALPPIAGRISDILKETDSTGKLTERSPGIPLFYSIATGVGLIPTIILVIRDRTRFRGKLSLKPK